MAFIREGKINLRYILIVVVLAVIVGGGIFLYQQLQMAEKETFLLATIPKSHKVVDDLVFSSNGKVVAYVTEENGKKFVVTNGKEGQRYDDIERFTLTMSPNGECVAYKASDGEKWFIVLNGQEGKKYDSIEYFHSFEYVCGGTYKAKDAGKEFVVFKGQEGKRYESVSMPRISPDGKQVAFWAVDEGKMFIVYNGQEGKKYPADKFHSLSSIIFGPKGDLVYGVQTKPIEQRVVYNGKEGKTYKYVTGFTFSENGEHFAYFARDDEGAFVVIDGKESDKKDYTGFPWGLTLGPDGKTYAYIMDSEQGRYVVFNGQKGKIYENIGALIMSPDGKQIAYEVFSYDEDKMFVVHNQQEGKKYNFVRNYDMNPIFSPDSNHLVYQAVEGEGEKRKAFIVLDGKEQDKRFYAAWNPIFSPDSKHLVYLRGKATGETFIVLNGKEKRTNGQVVYNLSFSADSKYISYGLRKGNELWWIVEPVE